MLRREYRKPREGKTIYFACPLPPRAMCGIAATPQCYRLHPMEVRWMHESSKRRITLEVVLLVLQCVWIFLLLRAGKCQDCSLEEPEPRGDPVIESTEAIMINGQRIENDTGHSRLGMISTAIVPRGGGPQSIGSRLELFVDDALIEHM